MAFLPKKFTVPVVFETERFCMRSLTIHDVVKDYDAVMSSHTHLWSMFGDVWGWPSADMTLEQDLIDLGWRQKEFQLRSSFSYAVMSLDQERLLGCVYIDPPSKPAFDAEVTYWMRASELDTGLDEYLGRALRDWLEASWPFESVAYPGREISWDALEALPD